MIEDFKRNGVTHVVLPSLPYDDITRFLEPAVLKEHSHFRVVHQTAPPATLVLEFRP
jgi:hypothetical protein